MPWGQPLKQQQQQQQQQQQKNTLDFQKKEKHLNIIFHVILHSVILYKSSAMDQFELLHLLALHMPIWYIELS